MKLRLLAITSVIGLIGMFGATGISQAAAPSSSVTNAHGMVAAAVSACRPGQLSMHNGPLISEKTQQETRIFVVRNTSSRACGLDGYPVVTLFTAHGAVLGFSYRDHGDQMLTSARPHLVMLAPGGNGYFAINKNACVLRSIATAWYLAAFPPNQLIQLRSSLDYCGQADPAGHVVDVSPFEKTVQALLAH